MLSSHGIRVDDNIHPGAGKKLSKKALKKRRWIEISAPVGHYDPMALG